MATVEFAPEYTKTERIRFVLVAFAVGAAVTLASRLWFFPWLREFAASAPCRSVSGVTGTTALFYGLLVGLPLFLAVLVGAFVGRRGYRVLREGCLPPSGEKVFRPTPIRRGTKAKLPGYVQLFSFTPLLALALWGAFQARQLVAQAELRPVKCVPNPSIEGTPNIRLRLLSVAPHVKR